MRKEFDWIKRWQKQQKLPAEVLLGIGDDCAAVRPTRRSVILLKCDACLEGIHFETGAPASQIGRKAMARALSDIAAMGGRPKFAILSLAFPSRFADRQRQALFSALRRTGRKYGCEIIGGDTTRSPGLLAISVFLYGEVARRTLLTRAKVRPGDRIWVTGRLGGSIRGKHLRFEPRLAEGRWLGTQREVRGAIDLSDGLGSDLRRVSEASGIGIEIDEARLPRNKGSDTRAALYDGEDYELLFFTRGVKSGAFEKKWNRAFRTRLSCIGVVRPRTFGIQLRGLGDRLTPIQTSYDHFNRHA